MGSVMIHTAEKPIKASDQAGDADPVETRVYMTTSETDEISREMLDMSEPDLFLHARCRTDLKTKLRVTWIGS